MNIPNIPKSDELERRRERKELLREIAELGALTRSIAARTKRLQTLDGTVEDLVTSITARMRKMQEEDPQGD